MKKIIKTVSLAIAGLMSLSIAACGGGGDDEIGDRRILKVEFLKAGFGLSGYEALAKAYMEYNPEVYVKLVPNYNINSDTETRLSANNNVSDVMCVRSQGDINRWDIKGWVEDITTLYNTEIADGKTLLQRMDVSASENARLNDHYNSIPEYTSVNGFVYNVGMFEKYGWEIPETTKELETLCKKIIKDTDGDVAPIVYCGAAADGYLYFALNNWITQYEGTVGLTEFYKYESPEVFNPANSLGKKYAMENLSKFFFDNDGEYCMANCMAKDHIEAQTDFIMGKAAMMLNGMWFETEMKEILAEYPEFELAMMKVPAVSDASGNVLHDSDYVDEKPVGSGGVGASWFIPSMAKNKDDAKDFLLFISKPEQCMLWTKTTNAVRPFEYDKDPTSEYYAKMSTFGKSILRLADENIWYNAYSHNPLALTGMLSAWPHGGYWNYKQFEDPERYTPEYCLQYDYQYALDNWARWQELIAG